VKDAARSCLPSALELRLRPPGGVRDAAIFDAATAPVGRAARLTALIEAGFAPPGAESPVEGWAMRLSIADREIALFRLALDHGRWPAWFVTRCRACDRLIDLKVAADEFPMTPAPGPVPVRLTVAGPGGAAVFRVPTGAEEAALESAPEAGLLALCAVSGVQHDAVEAWRQPFESALEAVLPRFAPELRFDCPLCGAETGWWFEPLPWIARHAAQCFAAVDALARRYCWSERAILTMSPARRELYLAMAGGGA
jgi:hypothetical protein